MTHRVLVVDDDVDFADSMTDYLELFGHHVDTAASCGAGIDLALNNDYDFIFMDIMLPDRSGIEGLTEILAAKPQASVTLMTGYSIAQLDRELEGRANVEVLPKPIDMDSLTKRLSAGAVH